ncbi:MAG TPA: hypothetical protein VG650_11735 [Mycobacteriales bacterium]|nr:hypothetical protein [Mycobacteriales bacterium]
MVGTGLSLVVGKLARTSLGAMLLTFAAGYLMHVTLDAPLAKEIAKADLSARGRLS